MLPDKVKILIDMGIGDGSLSKRKEGNDSYQFEVLHGYAQEQYLRHKAEVLQGFGYNANVNHYDYTGITANCTEYYRVRFCAKEAKTAHKYLYNEKKKRIDASLLSVMDRRSLAYWYFDDGHAQVNNIRRKDNYVYEFEKPWVWSFLICAYGFELDGLYLFQNWLLEKFNIRATVRSKGVVAINDNASKDVFLHLVQDYATPDLLYKVNNPTKRLGIPYIRYDKKDYHRNRLSETTPIQEDATVENITNV